ncbi:MAG: SDR family oxidoreductase [Alphaproteobacteria bacterium]|nr:SDR family oxidoreductase [Alphaproteobacteria bacterium]MCY4318589.1 SDR family oxidoreductase [Alphaproteobacteria bacterium]
MPKDKAVLITGAGSGIGEACAHAFAVAGARLALADIDRVAAANVAKACGGAIVIEADCGDVTSIEAMVDAAVGGLGGLDAAVNNAGVTRHADIMELTEADWDRIHRVNAKGVFFCLQSVARRMIAQGRGGRIINIASIAGRGFRGTSNAAYAASKGAVISLTKTAAQQLGRYDINVNAVCPGVTFTTLVEQLIRDRSAARGIPIEEMRRSMETPIPIGRGNDPVDIAELCVFLAGPGSRNVTGQAWNVDGGLITS